MWPTSWVCGNIASLCEAQRGQVSGFFLKGRKWSISAIMHIYNSAFPAAGGQSREHDSRVQLELEQKWPCGRSQPVHVALRMLSLNCSPNWGVVLYFASGVWGLCELIRVSRNSCSVSSSLRKDLRVWLSRLQPKVKLRIFRFVYELLMWQLPVCF